MRPSPVRARPRKLLSALSAASSRPGSPSPGRWSAGSGSSGGSSWELAEASPSAPASPPPELGHLRPRSGCFTVCATGLLAVARRRRWRTGATKLFEWATILSLFFVTEFYDFHYPVPDVPDSPTHNSSMPSAWDRRYFKQGVGQGLEVQIIRRGSAAGWWAVVCPGGELAEINVQDRRAVRATPDPEVNYQAMPVLSQERKDDLVEQANRRIAAGSLRRLTQNEPTSFSSELRRFLGVVATAPCVCGRWVRWALRTRYRFGGLCATLFLTYEGLSYSGIFDWLQARARRVKEIAERIVEAWTTSSEAVSEFAEGLSSTYNIVSSYVEPWKIPVYFIVLLLIYGFWRELAEGDVDSPTSSSAGTPPPESDTTPPVTPRADAQTAALQAVAEALRDQQEFLRTMADGQATIQDRLAEHMDERRTSQLLHEVRPSVAGPTTAMWEQISKRIADFEKVLKGDRGRPSSSGERAPSPEDPSPAPPVPSPEDLKAQVLGASKPTAMDSQVRDVIEKMKRTAERPHDKYLACLTHYQPEDASDWALHFPTGYRERCAPTFLGEVYSSGQTGKAFGKEYIRTRCLGDHGDARELIALLAAVDAMILQDQTPGIINSVALEKLCKRAYAIVAACQGVEKRDDWKKPANAGKGWRSKINEELWKRIDPSRAGADELAFTNRKVEEEIRVEVDRDAAMLKAFSKLEQRKPVAE